MNSSYCLYQIQLVRLLCVKQCKTHFLQCCAGGVFEVSSSIKRLFLSRTNPPTWSHSATAPSLHPCLHITAFSSTTQKSLLQYQKMINPFNSWPRSQCSLSPEPSPCNPASHYLKDIKIPICGKIFGVSNTVKYSQMC